MYSSRQTARRASGTSGLNDCSPDASMPHDFAWLDLAQELGAEVVERAGLGGQDVRAAAAVQPADAERPDARAGRARRRRRRS